MMKALLPSLIVSIVTLFSLPTLAQEAVPDITGSWTGTFTGGVRGGGGQLMPSSNPPDFVSPGDAMYTLEITEQNGRGFVGTWSAEVGSETTQGVIRLDNKTLLIVDDDTTQVATLLSENEMEFCAHSRTITDRFTLCFLLKRE